MIKQAILRGADAFDAARKFDTSERAAFMNASEAETCIRKQWYSKHEPEAGEEQSWGYARRGLHGELYMVERLRLANVNVIFGGEDQVSIKDDDLRISATPDGLVWDDDHKGWIACEFKTIDPRTNRSKLPSKAHTSQVQIGAALFEKHREEFPELGDHPILGCRLIYMDASNYNDVLEFVIPVAPKILDRLKSRANRILDSRLAGSLPREGKETPFQSECKQRCSFNAVCNVAGAGSSTGMGKTGAGDLSTQRLTYLTAKETAAEAKQQQDSAAEQIKAIMAREGMSSIAVDDGVVKLAVRPGSVSYAKVVKECLPDIDLGPYTGNPSETLTVK